MGTTRARVLIAIGALVLAGCASSTASSSDGTSRATATSETGVTDGSPPITPSGGFGPAVTAEIAADVTAAATPGQAVMGSDGVVVPSTYDGSKPVPLVVLLHGYGGNGGAQEGYYALTPLAESRGFLLVYPDGTVDLEGRPFWNATDACCNQFLSDVDHSTVLSQLIARIEDDYNVDSKRIFVVGHSNGGFMSYRMACDHADTIAAIVSMAGATFADPTRCSPSEPVSVLEVHGTSDEVIRYDGGDRLGNDYPGARLSTLWWAGYDGCAATTVPSAANLDLTSDIEGPETTVEVYTGCPTGVSVQLWTVFGGSHVPTLTTAFAPGIIDFLYAHPKP